MNDAQTLLHNATSGNSLGSVAGSGRCISANTIRYSPTRGNGIVESLTPSLMIHRVRTHGSSAASTSPSMTYFLTVGVHRRTLTTLPSIRARSFGPKSIPELTDRSTNCPDVQQPIARHPNHIAMLFLPRTSPRIAPKLHTLLPHCKNVTGTSPEANKSVKRSTHSEIRRSGWRCSTAICAPEPFERDFLGVNVENLLR